MVEYKQSHFDKRNLDEWLYYLENLHIKEIDMGLTRIAQVAARLSIDLSFAQVITVAGTNGKGTTCAFIENALLSKNKTVAVYSSPHIDRFNERLRIDKSDIDDDSIIAAFNQIEDIRGEISLSYYEYTTLAAFLVTMVKRPDFIILEVGLGGRLDATNIIDANIAVLTTVDLDHQAFLGNDRESIGFEKAGIMRPGQWVVVGESKPPKSVTARASELKVNDFVRDRDFFIENNGETWTWTCPSKKTSAQVLSRLPTTKIPQDNVATALMVLSLLPVELTECDVKKLILDTQVAGRAEIFHDSCQVMVDVGHNPLAARYLEKLISSLNYNKIHAVVGMLSDKDIGNTLKPLIPLIDDWYVSSLDVPRGASAKQLKEFLPEGDKHVVCFDNVADAYKMTQKKCSSADLVLVFGSFYTVAEVRRILI